MNNPLHAAYYADDARQHLVVVEDRRELARDTYLVRFACSEIAAKITPGQFLMVRSLTGSDPLLGRAFAMYDVVPDAAGQPRSVDIVFHTVGKMTHILSNVNVGDEFSVWGPLGNGFVFEAVDHLIMVAGGIGQTPFLALAKECLGTQTFGRREARAAKKVSLCYGARSADLLAGIEDFKQVGIDVHVATDDGSAGHHGLVTDLLKELVTTSPSDNQVVCCGPEPMMEAVAKYCVTAGLRCQISLETPMACGLGICFSCVTKVNQSDGSWDFKRTCVDGPVFDAADLCW